MKALAIAGVMALVVSSPVFSQDVQTPPSIIGPCWVIGVQDGDSITVRTTDEERIDVRYIGIDAPERERSFGGEALNRNAELVEGHEVWLEVEVTDGRYLSDRDGRVLAYVFLDSECSKLVQEVLISEGLALIDVRNVVDRDLYPDAFPIRYSARFIEAQIEAACNRRGLWVEMVPERGGLIIAAIEFWGEIETVYLVNIDDEAIDLAANWVLMDEHAHERWEKGETPRYLLKFGPTLGPECALPPGGILKICTGSGIPERQRRTRVGCGTSEVTFNWCGSKVWDNRAGDTAFLYSPDGELYFTYQYPWQERGA